jgi:AcrR family transcriptional regulator
VEAQRRLGRPPAQASAETRERIIAAARECFGCYGFDKTTNQRIARQAGITSGAIYHYFESKQELFAAVADETLTTVLSRFRAARAEGQPIVEQLVAVLEAAAELNAEDPSMAMFVSSSPIEIRRHQEFAALADEQGGAMLGFFEEMVHEAKARGEIPPDVDPGAVAVMLMATTAGLALQATIGEGPEAHRRIIGVFERLIAGTLLTPGGPTERSR